MHKVLVLVQKYIYLNSQVIDFKLFKYSAAKHANIRAPVPETLATGPAVPTTGSLSMFQQLIVVFSLDHWTAEW